MLSSTPSAQQVSANVGYCLPFAGAPAAKSLQSCPTLCDPIDGSPPGSPCHSQRALNVRVLRDVCVLVHCHRGGLRQDLAHGRCSIKYCLNEYMSGFFLVGLDGTLARLPTLLEEHCVWFMTAPLETAWEPHSCSGQLRRIQP